MGRRASVTCDIIALSNLAWSNSIINGVAFNGNTFFYYYLGGVLYNHHHCIGILGTAGRQAPIQDADKNRDPRECETNPKVQSPMK